MSKKIEDEIRANSLRLMDKFISESTPEYLAAMIDKFDVKDDDYDLPHERSMVQSRILSPFVMIMERQDVSNEELSILTGIPLKILEFKFACEIDLTVTDIVLIQAALGVKMQPPEVLTNEEHNNKFYN